LIAEFEIEGMNELLVGIQVDPVLNVCRAEELLRIALCALEAVWALPVALRDLDQLGLKAPVVVNFVAYRADQESFPLLG